MRREQESRSSEGTAEREKFFAEGTSVGKPDWKLWAAKVICLAAALTVLWFLLKYTMSLFLPFLMALLLSAVVRPGAIFLEKRAGIPRRAGGILLLLVLVAGSLLFLIWSGGRLVVEGQRFIRSLQVDSGAVSDWIADAEDFITTITAHIPPLAHLRERGELEKFWRTVDARAAQIITDTVAGWSAKIPLWVTTMIGSIPSAMVFLITLLLAAFYFCADGGTLSEGVASRLSPAMQERWQRLRGRITRVSYSYLRAYFILFLLTFIQLIIGFSLLRLPYVFLPALVIALVDILPVLGVGSVLVPWGIIELLRGQTRLGFGLLILFGVMILLRQMMEPRIVGHSLGLHPLLTLFAFYVGLKLFGIPGMLLSPAVALLIKSIVEGWWPAENKPRAGEDSSVVGKAEGTAHAEERRGAGNPVPLSSSGAGKDEEKGES